MISFDKDFEFQEEALITDDKKSLLFKYIEDTILDLKDVIFKTKDEFGIERVVQDMALLTSFYNRVLNADYGRVNFPVNDLECFFTDLASSDFDKGSGLQLVIREDDSILKEVTLLSNGVEALAIRLLEEDRFSNEAMISPIYSRGEVRSKFFLFSADHIFGDNGVYVSDEDCNFISSVDGLKKANSTGSFSYNYLPYYIEDGDLVSIRIDRNKNIRRVNKKDRRKSFSQRFRGIYDLNILGGMPRSDDEVLEFIYKSRLEDIPKEKKVYTKQVR